MNEMTSLPDVTALYAGIFGIMAIAVAFPAGAMRGKTGISIGDGGNPDLLLAMRRHGNFAEYVPMLLVLIGLLEMNGVSEYAIHGLGVALLVGRILHALGLKADSIQDVRRGLGAGLTALVTLVSSVWLIYTFLS